MDRICPIHYPTERLFRSPSRLSRGYHAGMRRDRHPSLWGPLFGLLALVSLPAMLIWPWLRDEIRWPVAATSGSLLASVFILWIVRFTNRK